MNGPNAKFDVLYFDSAIKVGGLGVGINEKGEVQFADYIYDSKTGGTFSNALAPEVEKTMVVPQYFGDLGMCIYQDRRNRVNWRGNFDVIKCYSDTPVAPYPTYDEMLRGINGINFSGITTTYPNIYHLQVYNFSNIFIY